MTTAFPDGADRKPDADFSDIVSGIEPYMDWSATAADLDAAAASPVSARKERKRRRQWQRELRAEELAAADDERERLAAEYAREDGYTPPEPPPLPRFRTRTLLSVLSVILGFVLLLVPAVLPVSATARLIVGTVAILGGAAGLFAGLRTSHHEPGEGWDDGSQV